MKFQLSLYTIFSKKIYYLTEQDTDQSAPDQFTIPLNKFALAASTASVCTSSGVAVAVGATGNSTQSQSRQCSRQSSQVLQRLWSFQLWQNANILILPYYSACSVDRQWCLGKSIPFIVFCYKKVEISQDVIERLFKRLHVSFCQHKSQRKIHTVYEQNQNALVFKWLFLWQSYKFKIFLIFD